jgi:acetate kinase
MITQSEAIVVLIAGAASLRFALYDASAASLDLLASGRFEGTGETAGFLAQDHRGIPIANESVNQGSGGFDHAAAVAHLAAWLFSQYGDQRVLVAVGHKITQGGAQFAEPVLLNSDVLEGLEQLVPFAPFDQPHNLVAVRAVSRLQPNVTQVACFDTVFHRHRSRITERFALPDDLVGPHWKRWGSQGLSFESVASRFARIAPQVASGSVIIAHLGHSVSLCAMKAGRSVDTTTGFSTLAGLPMATRSGTVDPGLILHLLQHMTTRDLQDALYNRSGLLGISGISGDMRTLLAIRDPRAAEAVNFFVYRVIREISSLAGALGGFDALVFTAGIGVNSPPIRARICRGLAWLGIQVDAGCNERAERCISPPACSPSVWVIASSEEEVIAAHTWQIVSMLPHRISHTRGGRDDRAVAEG